MPAPALDVIRTDIGDGSPVLTLNVAGTEVAYCGDHLDGSAVMQVGTSFVRTPDDAAKGLGIDPKTSLLLWMLCAGAMDELHRQMQQGVFPGSVMTALLQNHTRDLRAAISHELI